MIRIRIILLQIFLALALVSCGSAPDLDPLQTRTGFFISLEDSELVQTRSTPAQIGKPASGFFNITVLKDYGSSTETVFEGPYSSGLIPVSAGSYNLYATCGENAELAFDSPFYTGSAKGSQKGPQHPFPFLARLAIVCCLWSSRIRKCSQTSSAAMESLSVCEESLWT